MLAVTALHVIPASALDERMQRGQSAGERGAASMVGTVIATTASGSSYVLSIDLGGVRWFRVPAPGSMARAATGWQEFLPRVVPGERLLLGTLRSTPVVSVAFLPSPESRPVEPSDDEAVMAWRAGPRTANSSAARRHARQSVAPAAGH
jgi:hypothetical protein